MASEQKNNSRPSTSKPNETSSFRNGDDGVICILSHCISKCFFVFVVSCVVFSLRWCFISFDHMPFSPFFGPIFIWSMLTVSELVDTIDFHVSLSPKTLHPCVYTSANKYEYLKYTSINVCVQNLIMCLSICALTEPLSCTVRTSHPGTCVRTHSKNVTKSKDDTKDC